MMIEESETNRQPERAIGKLPELAAGYGPSKIPVLDHGYVQFVEAWGKGATGGEMYGVSPDYEVGIVEAARQSTQGSFRGWDQDEKLLRTLFNHQANQSTPFEAAGMTIEVQAPILVFREWHRHRTQSYNEASARYTQLPDLCYTPDYVNVEDRMWAAWRTRNKQAGAATTSPNQDYIAEWLEDVTDLYEQAEAIYRAALENGIPKELARITMPVGHYSRMRATANLRNWLAFLTLRMDEKAQWEIRKYANAVACLISQHFPRTWSLFEESERGKLA